MIRDFEELEEKLKISKPTITGKEEEITDYLYTKNYDYDDKDFDI